MGGFIRLKYVVIVLVVAVTGLGFALGFFYAARLKGPDRAAVETAPGPPGAPGPTGSERTARAAVKVVPPKTDARGGVGGGNTKDASLRDAVRTVRKGPGGKPAERPKVPPTAPRTKKKAVAGTREAVAGTREAVAGTPKAVKPAAAAGQSGRGAGGGGGGWYAQAGAFQNPSQANALKKALEDKGYKVYIVRHAARGGRVFLRVRVGGVGGFASKREALRAAHRLKDKEGLSAFVVTD